MLTQDILKALSDNIETIINIGKDIGFINIRMFKPPLAIDKNNLNFLVDVDETKKETISLEEQGRFQWKLNKLLKYKKVSIHIADEIGLSFKEDIINKAVPLSSENMNVTQEWFKLNKNKRDLSSDNSAKRPKLIQAQLEINDQPDEVKLTMKFEKAGDKNSLCEADYLAYAIDCLQKRAEALVQKPLVRFTIK